MESDKKSSIKKTGHLVNKLINTGFINIFSSSVINKFINFAYGIVLVRIISKSAYGSYSYANNMYSYFALFLGLGIAESLLQVCSEVGDNKEQKENYFSFCYSFSVYFNILLSISVLICSFVIETEIDNVNYLLRIMGLLPTFTQFTPLYTNWLRANFKNKEYARLNNINTILIAILSIGGALLFQAYGLIIGRYFAAVGTIGYAIFNLKCPIQKPKRVKYLKQFSERRRILKIALTLCISGACVQIISLIGVSVLGNYIPDEELIASYKTATVIPTALSFIANAALVYAYPYFAKHSADLKWTQRTYLYMTGGLFIGIGIISILGFVLAEPIVTTVFGSQYADSKIPFKILMINLFINSVFRIPANNLLITQMKLRFCFIVSIVGAFFTVLLNVLLVPTGASDGAAYAQLLSTIFLGILCTGYYVCIICIKGNTYEKKNN